MRQYLKVWIRILCIILIVLGVFFRFSDLNKKVYWPDEFATSLRVTGHTLGEAEFVQRQAISDLDGRIVSADDLQKYLFPPLKRGLLSNITQSSADEPQLPPLYFTLTNLGVQWFGHSANVTRGISVLAGILAFPCLFWLCLELFNSEIVGWIAVSLFAISPFHMMYAQEARPYSLWTTTILLSSAVLLRAIRYRTRICWGLYSLCLALSFYTFLFSGFVAIGHGIYVLGIAGWRLNKTVKSYLLASTLGLIVFIPWLLSVATNLRRVGGLTSWVWKSQGTSLLLIVQTWLLNLSHIFVDLSLDHNSKSFGDISFYSLLSYLSILLAGYSIFYLCKNTSRRIWLFALTLMVMPALALLIPDILRNSKLSTVARYSTPTYLGVQLAVAYLFATLSIKGLSALKWQFRLTRVLLAMTLSFSLLSCFVILQSKVWRNKVDQPEFLEIAQLVNQTSRPLVVSDDFGLAYFSYLVDSKVRFQLIDIQNDMGSNLEESSSLIEISNSDQFQKIFLYNIDAFQPSKELLESFKANPRYQLTLMIHKELDPFLKVEVELWQLEKRVIS
ncbi:MAG: glycosyltransferase family 39 protein [Leptolyngbyaceae cyanobacterium bins.302]|nr:glycosyltransferase family 39 protein [Leptolyngbyaceae cyanobacterium bins.302]